MASIYRVLIKTHHMTSRKKILVITKAAKQLSCSVVLKTGAPPGIMLAEGEGAEEWLKVVRKLRYKNFHLLQKSPVSKARLDIIVGPGSVRELDSLKDFGELLRRDYVLYEWWRVWMGWAKSGDDGR